MTIGEWINENLRGKHLRIFGFALFDLSLTVLAAYVLVRWYSSFGSISNSEGVSFRDVLIVTLVLWILGIIAHVLTNTPAMSSYYLGLSGKPRIMQ